MPAHSSAVILHDRVSAGAPPDAADVLVQADAVAASLARLGYDCCRLEGGPDMDALARELDSVRPALVFNLVESIAGSGEHIDDVPALLQRLGLPFTGAPADAMRLTTAKPAAKELLRVNGIATPGWWSDEDPAEPDVRWIVKSAWEDASHGLDDDAVVCGSGAARRRLAASRARWGGNWFAERYVEGREFNVSLIAGEGGPLVLPLAEIEFRDFPAGKPRVVGYRAKWEESSFEYCNTPRRLVDELRERSLCSALRGTALRCWELFGLRGYARVDFRVDEAGEPWVLEVNANPCLSPDAGFAAALAAADMSFDDAIARILEDAGVPRMRRSLKRAI